jgi:ubiquinol-cytochrome c reductase iron-sulfur subunit
MTSPWVERRIAAAFLVSALCAAGFVVAYVLDAATQVLGGLIGAAFAALAYGMASWSTHLLPDAVVVEEKEPLAPAPGDPQDLEQELRGAGAFPAVVRRSLLLGVGALGVAALVPLRSLLFRGTTPEQAFADTSWRAGRNLVTRRGIPVRAEDLAVGTVLTAYPEGHLLAQDAVVVVVRLEPGQLRLPAGRADWAVDGIVAFSKLCTHVGCPVGLYEQTTQHLLCPCHQSAFDVPAGAVPVQGPAARPLPQLPLELGPDGVLRAGGGFEAPVGPTWWRRT